MDRQRPELTHIFHSLVLGDFCIRYMNVRANRLNLRKLPTFDNFQSTIFRQSCLSSTQSTAGNQRWIIWCFSYHPIMTPVKWPKLSLISCSQTLTLLYNFPASIFYSPSLLLEAEKKQNGTYGRQEHSHSVPMLCPIRSPRTQTNNPLVFCWIYSHCLQANGERVPFHGTDAHSRICHRFSLMYRHICLLHYMILFLRKKVMSLSPKWEQCEDQDSRFSTNDYWMNKWPCYECWHDFIA